MSYIGGTLNNYKRLFIFASLGLNLVVLTLFFTPLSNYLYAFLEIKPEIVKTKAIILLSSSQYDSDILEKDTYQRIFQTYKLYKLGFADKIIVCGGILIKGNPPISKTIKDVLVDLGINSDAILTEVSSHNTYENIKYIIPILREQNIVRPLLVTSSYHMYRSLAVCQKLGLVAYPAPVPCYEKKLSTFMLRSRHVLTVLREYGAIFYFWLRGWI